MSGKLFKLWAHLSVILVSLIILFLFGFVFISGYDAVSWEFLTEAPGGMVLGTEGGIAPAIAGSLWFTLTALVIGGLPATATAIFVTFFCSRVWLRRLIHTTVQVIAGIPSIVLGLFSYSLMVRDLGIGRCIFSAGVALGIMVLPFIEVRMEKALEEVPRDLIKSGQALGCSRLYTVFTLALPQARSEMIAALILGGCFAMGATAPLIFTGGVAYAAMPSSIWSPAMALSLHLYLLLAQGTNTSIRQIYGTAFVLMAIVLTANVLVTLYARRNKSWRKS